ncbi:MAG: RDD family protein [Micromonosporaceae bacterium]
MTVSPTLTEPPAQPPAETHAQPSSEPRVVSGEAVELDIRVARAGSRVPALLIDIVVQVMLFYALIMLGGALLLLVTMSGLIMVDDTLARGLMLVAVVVVLIGYPAAMETFLRGRTLGKLVLGLRVVRDDGGPIRFRQALTRALVGASLEWPGLVLPPLTWLASLWTMIAHPHGKRLGDLAAGTIVIHERTPEAWGWVPVMPPHLAAWARTLDLVGLDDDLALAVRHFLARNRRLKEPARTRLGYQLARQVAAVTNPPPPPGTPGWAYLAAVLAERHRRAALRLAAARQRAAAHWHRPPEQ